MTRLVIAVLYGGQEGSAIGAAEGPAATAVESACRANGWIPFRFRVEDLGALRRALLASRPALAFNLVHDGFHSRDPKVPELLDAMAIPYTGSSGHTLALPTDKLACRARLSDRGLPVAPPAVVEALLLGRRLSVCLLEGPMGVAILGVAEDAIPCFPADLDLSLPTTVEGLAVGAWHAMGMRGYGRVDLRLDAHCALGIIDVDPTPDLSPLGSFSVAAQRAGLPHEALVAQIVNTALRRGG